VSVQDPVYLPVDVQTTVFLRQGSNVATVRATILKALADFFAVSLPDGTPNPNVNFGFNDKDEEGNPARSLRRSLLSTAPPYPAPSPAPEYRRGPKRAKRPPAVGPRR
jgi:hypothetical protein